MPDGHVRANDRRLVLVGMDHGIVLDVTAFADLDAVHVATQHRAEPDGRTFGDAHVADEDGGRRDEGVRCDLRSLAAVFVEGHRP